jgi:hypothetical protein
MALVIVLNILFAAFVIVAIVGGLAWSIVRDRQVPVGTAALARTARPAATGKRPAAGRPARGAYATS